MGLRHFSVKGTASRTVKCGRASFHKGISVLLFRFVSTNKAKVVEALWRNFFSNTSQWWDHRPEKTNPRFPDFKHKQTGVSLWLADARTPQWAQVKLAALPPGTLQPNIFWQAQRLKIYVKTGQYIKTMDVFHQMEEEKICPDIWSFLPILNACAALGALEEGKRIHGQIIRVGCESNVYVATCLIDMYNKCGSIEDAWSVFKRVQKHNVVTWSAMIVGCVKSGQGLKAIELFHKMEQEKVEPDAVTFIGVLNACASLAALEEGRRIHQQVIGRGYEADVYICSSLVAMYAKCGRIDDGWNVFNKMREHDAVTWSTIIGGYAKSGQSLKAIKLFQEMEQTRVEPDAITFVGVLSACAKVAAIEEGRRIHRQITEKGYETDVYVGNCLVGMYAKCRSIEDAWSVFIKMQNRNVVTWNAIIGGYSKSGQGLKALALFQKMRAEGPEPNVVTFIAVLNACASVGALEKGRHIHDQIIGKGYESDLRVGNCLIDMYAKCRSIDDAWSVFNKIPEHNVVTWSAIIRGYVKSGQGLKAMELFKNMQQKGIESNIVTFVAVLNACASVAALEDGRRVHEQIVERGCACDVNMGNCLIDMYAKCGSIEDAWSVFNKMPVRNVVSWSSMIVGYVKSGQALNAIELFQQMEQEGVEPDAGTFVGMLNACASVGALEEGKRVHGQITERGYESDIYVATCLVDMYTKCGNNVDAQGVFDKTQQRNVVTWSAMIIGYARSREELKALGLFQKMEQEGVEADIITFVGVLNACASVAALQEGRRVHRQIIQRGYISDVYLGSCLVDMYAKCGSIEDAQRTFNEMQERNGVTWNAMIGGYAMHGHAEKAVGLFEQMGNEGVEIDAITFTCLLSACSHGGLVNEGLQYFESMRSCFNLIPTTEHYACTIDLLGRAGRLLEAEELTKNMSLEKDVYVWMSVLGASRIHGNIEIAERAAKRCWELDPGNASGHVLLSNTYAAIGKWDSNSSSEEERSARKGLQEHARTWIEVNNVVHPFVMEDKEHSQVLEIHAELERLSLQMHDAGYVPDMRFGLHEEMKRSHLSQ